MHRSRTGIVTHAPARLQPKARDFHRKGVATTYKLHDRYLSNRRARGLYSANRPSIDGTQHRVIGELHDVGYSLVTAGELFSAEAWQSVQEEGAEFVQATEQGLEGDGDLRKREGKDFLVRKYDVGGVLGLDNPWLSACISRRLIDIANEYLQLWSKLEYLDLWYSLPVGESAERKASQIWHRDFDDSHLLKVFLYLSDVDERSGPFEYVPGSQPGGRYAGVHPWSPWASAASRTRSWSSTCRRTTYARSRLPRGRSSSATRAAFTVGGSPGERAFSPQSRTARLPRCIR